MWSSSWKGDESVLACQPATTNSAGAYAPTRYVVASIFHVLCVLCTSRVVQAASFGSTWGHSANKKQKCGAFF